MPNLLARWLQTQAVEHDRLVLAWRFIARPHGDLWAAYLKRWGGLHAVGEHCSIWPTTRILDPAYVSLGDNVRLSTCTIIGHDGSIAMLNRAYATTLDGVGFTKFHDNVFVGLGAILLPNISVGPNAIVAAGAVVTKDVPPGAVVAGNPARVIGQVEDLVRRREASTAELPWFELLRSRGQKSFDSSIEPELVRQRVEHFFPGVEHADPQPARPKPSR